MKLLVVEDDAQLAELLARVFAEAGHGVSVRESLSSANRALAEMSFDLVVLDWMLPDGDGIELCTRLRQRKPPIPVLMLTARGEVQDRVLGLKAGADDYLTKPFEVDELLARVEAVHRRVNEPWITRVGAVAIDHRGQSATVNGQRLELTAREYALLARLARGNGACVSRAELLSDVWNTTFDPGSGVIDVLVSRLRDKLGETGALIETVRGRGLRLRLEP